MTVTSDSQGHRIEFRDGTWVFVDSGDPLTERPCANCGREAVDLELTTVADLSCTGKETRRVWPIDACIADIVAALDTAGIKMRHSCCGHGKGRGDILLEDGRVVWVLFNS
jgi:hypothetical protein